MTQSYRLPPQPGEGVDRSRPLAFRFEGRSYSGFAGDTVASALAANGVRMLGRSFKYHRPRGIYSLANHDCNNLMQAGARINLRADVTPLWDGADLRAVNTLGGLRGDWLRFLDAFSAFLPVGFYYKAFHSPRALFPFWERRMRAAAGLGRVDPAQPRLHTPKDYGFCDVLVVGAGASGLSAALAAAECGARVVVVDEQPRAGGSLAYAWDEADALALEDLRRQVAAQSQVDLRLGTVAAGYYADRWIALVDEKRLQKIRARAVVVASGCSETPAVFRHNDLPGVMLASAAQRLIRLYSVKPFDRAVVLAAHPDGYRAALGLRACGVHIAALADLRPEGESGALRGEIEAAGIPIYPGHAVYEALPAGGKQGIRGVRLCPLDTQGRPQAERAFRAGCDGIAVSVGWSAADSLLCQAGARMVYDERLARYLPEQLPEGLFAAGRVNGMQALEVRLADGRRAGQAAAAFLGLYRGALPEVSRADASPGHPFPIFDHPHGKNFVDFDEDVQVKDLVHGAQEGFAHVELSKRYTTFGMGPSQGKLSNVNAVRVLARVRGLPFSQIGSPRARPFVHPVPLGHLAGRGFHPHRRTPLHARHEQAGAQFMMAGEWMRPAVYALCGKSREAAIAGEVRAVRQGLGLIDVGTLGKLEICGPDAAEFLERIYTGRFANMKPGTTRYGLMCDESGVIVDDGVVARLDERRFYVSTTTAASGAVYRELQRWALVWGLQVVLINATGQYGALNLAGPLSREVLAPLAEVDLSEEAFPYLGIREGAVLGVPARLSRVGFVGELGFEIHVPAQSAARVWDGLCQAGQRHGLRPFGVEAQRVLRLEKGHAIVGQDTDGLTNPFEAHMEWALKMDKPFFVGQRSLQILQRKRLQRRLVGFTLPPEHAGAMPKECHLVIENGEIAGRVTSVTFSPTLNRVIGLAYVRPAQADPGAVFRIRCDGGSLAEATVSKLPFYDPKNLRNKAERMSKTLVAAP